MKPFFHPAFHGKFGVARRDITPPAGIYSRNWGAAHFDVATSTHRPITLTALTIQEEAAGEPLAIISLDLGWWRSTEEEGVLRQAVLAAGVLEGRYLLALSHTHSGPIFCPGESEKPGGELIAGYLQNIATQIREAITEALTNIKPGILEAATGKCGLASNRDLPDPQTGRLLVGWNPEIDADETLLFGRVSDHSGRCLATLVNYACHPTILAWENTTISPDFIGAMREVVESETSAPCLFLQSASGELAARHQYVGEPRVADQAGRSLGHAALGIFYGMLEPGHELAFQGAVESGAPLAVWASQKRAAFPSAVSIKVLQFDLPLKTDFPSVEEILRQIETCTDRVLGERLQRRLLHRRSLGDGTLVPRTHHLWQLGEIIILSLADEAYSDLQIELRKTAKDRPVFIATLTNGSRGYLSPRHSYQAESYASGQSPYAEGCFEETLAHLQIEIQTLS